MWQKVIYFLLLVLVFVCAVGTIICGGRGAFIYLVLVISFLIIRIMRRETKQGRGKYYFMLAGASVVMIFLALHFNVFGSEGGLRVVNSLLVDDTRNELTRIAIDSYVEAPLFGHGLGSVWWEVGFYSHNMFQDMLVEGGIFGLIILLLVLGKMLISLLRESKENNFDLVVLLLFLSHLVHDTFSGYWISSFCIFWVFGYVFGKKFISNSRRSSITFN